MSTLDPIQRNFLNTQLPPHLCIIENDLYNLQIDDIIGILPCIVFHPIMECYILMWDDTGSSGGGWIYISALLDPASFSRYREFAEQWKLLAG